MSREFPIIIKSSCLVLLNTLQKLLEMLLVYDMHCRQPCILLPFFRLLAEPKILSLFSLVLFCFPLQIHTQSGPSFCVLANDSGRRLRYSTQIICHCCPLKCSQKYLLSQRPIPIFLQYMYQQIA